MAISQTTFTTPNAEKYLNQLCKHWNHRFPVTYTPYEGWIPFSAEKICKLDAEEGVLRIRLSLADSGQMEQFQNMVVEHLRRFAFREEPGQLIWSDGDEEDAASFATVPDFVEQEVEATGILKDHAVRVSGRTVVMTYSEGPGRPLLLFHGLGGSARSFVPVMPALEAAGFRPVAVNMPGYRGSDRLYDDFPTLEQFAEHLRGLLDEIAIMRADILGHSLGGVLASTLAHFHPDRVDRMVLSSPPRGFGLGGPENWPEAHTKRIADLIAEGPELYAQKRAASLCAEGADEPAVEAVRGEMARLTPEGLRAASSLYARADLHRLLAESTSPIHFLSGDRDRIVPANVVAEHGAVLGKAVTAMTGVGHAGYAEDSEQFAEAVIGGFTSLPILSSIV
ncbi:alpha/beta fold hydrolase [Rhizobium puerariae]|uniref:Alpha/beta fold hydrolase n=1 Tax=Rhizobium puerariae TaxID=1585791 RepID=A0ABV6AA00_9HYPH